MANKPPKTIQDQIALLQERDMQFKNIKLAPHFLSNISYYRLKGYWWEMQDDKLNHHFAPNSFFEDIIDLYNFDRHFRLIVFNAIERIEVALRAKLIYHLSLAYGEEWYLNQTIFKDKFQHAAFLSQLSREIKSSSEEFMKKHLTNHPNNNPEAWKALEVVTLGALSKIYDNLASQMPEKSRIANEFGLNSSKDFASWLRTITLIRNIIAHHGRLWNRVLINKYSWPRDLTNKVLSYIPDDNRKKKIFPLLCGMIYLNDMISPGHSLRIELKGLIAKFPNTQLYKMGFPPNWSDEPLFSNDI